MRTNHNASGKPSLEGCVGLRYPLRWVLQATYPWVCGILTEYDKEELTVRLVKTGLVSQMALKELLDKAEEKGMSILKSYILQCLNDSKNPKQNFYI